MSQKIVKVAEFGILLILPFLAIGVTESFASRGLLNVVASRGLYVDDSRVTVLNSTNFKTSVYGTHNAWLIEFYSSWCGFCQRFASTWKALSASIFGWKDVMIAAAIDCADEDNTPLCREYEIMRYPTVKFFPANTKIGELGTDVDKGKTADDIRHNAIDLLRKEQIDGRGSSWPNLIPYRSSDIQNLWKNAPDTVRYIFLIFEEMDSYIGSEVIVDLHNVKEMQIRSVLNQNEALAKLLGITSFPSVIVLERNKNALTLKVGDKTREDFNKAIKIFLESKNINIPEDTPVDSHEKRSTEVAGKAKETDNNQLMDIVFQVDLDLALKQSLKHEIPLKNVISGESLKALKNYLHVLYKYFPTDYSGKSLLQALFNYVLENNSELRGIEFHEYFTKIEHQVSHSPFAINHNWVGCKGSAPSFRGYPCGVWTMFHTLTVNAVINDGTSKNFDSLEVLHAMLGYVKNFFGCYECSQHFQKMAEKSMNTNVSKPNDSIIWLWKAHNEVNRRLAGDSTEDPKHPKIQFPSVENCQGCRNTEGDWIYSEVLKYLKKMYSKDNIHSINLDQNLNELERTSNQNIRKRDSITKIDTQRLGWNFNIFDVSLCVILYLISAGILCMVFLKFLVRKRYKKKHYIHDLLGKV